MLSVLSVTAHPEIADAVDTMIENLPPDLCDRFQARSDEDELFAVLRGQRIDGAYVAGERTDTDGNTVYAIVHKVTCFRHPQPRVQFIEACAHLENHARTEARRRRVALVRVRSLGHLHVLQEAPLNEEVVDNNEMSAEIV